MIALTPILFFGGGDGILYSDLFDKPYARLKNWKHLPLGYLALVTAYLTIKIF